MKLQTAISTLLALWFGLSACFGPRFLCVCADGTTTTQFGEQFCCDGPSEAPCPSSAERSDGTDDCVVCADGECQSTSMKSESIVAVDRLEKDTDEDWSLDGPDDPTFPWFEFLASRSASTTSMPRPPVLSGIGFSACHLRSVILLV